MDGKQREQEPVSNRKYILNLSDADAEKLAVRAGQYGLTAGQLLENFIADLVGGASSNGSDEREYANRWAERCGFGLDAGDDRNLIAFACCLYDVYVIEETLYHVESARKSLESAKEELESAKEELEFAEDEWRALQEEFADYMGDKPYVWEEELESFLQWRKKSIPEEEYDGTLDAAC